MVKVDQPFKKDHGQRVEKSLIKCISTSVDMPLTVISNYYYSVIFYGTTMVNIMFKI